ncbi:MAG: acetate CoA/acetoacetate CoA-transferase alpha subunit [Clostridiales bacterium]|nr:acetate CoA/acetoacetate CoA-transferase alpha subunit [Clostridiales bacterium]
MDKQISIEEAVAQVKDGMTVMIGGFLACGSPHRIIDALVQKGVKDLTIIANDTGFIDKGIGKLVVNGQVKKVVATHIGTNKETGRLMNEGKMEVVLVPQGTLAEQIRAAGAGLGGVLTPIGIGTPVAEGKDQLVIDGKTYLLEKPVKADIALIAGTKVDVKGNVFYREATQNFNPLMATAADLVIVEAGEVVEAGGIDPHLVMTPGLFVDYIVKA